MKYSLLLALAIVLGPVALFAQSSHPDGCT